MPGFQVDPDQLVAGSRASGGGCRGDRWRRGLVALGCGGGRRGRGACGAGEDWGAAWEGELAGRAQVLRRTGENLAAAAEAYRETDEGQMRT